MNELQEKLKTCMNITQESLDNAEVKNKKGEKLIKFARDYYKDAEYYKEKEPETALEAVSYAHGFLDSGVLLGHIKIPDYQLKKEVE